MKVPTIKKEQILQSKGSYNVANASAARKRGEAFSKFAKGAAHAGDAVADYLKASDAKSDRIAVRNGKSAFNKFKAEWNDKVRNNLIKPDDYKKEYENAYSEYFGKFYKNNPNNLGEVVSTVEGMFSSSVDGVNADGFVAKTKAQDREDALLDNAAQKNVYDNPSSFGTEVLNNVENTEAQIRSKEMSREVGEDRLKKRNAVLAESAAQGFVMQGKHKDALAFLANPEIANMLGNDKVKELFASALNGKAARENDVYNQKTRAYAEEQKAIKKAQETELIGSLQAIVSADSPEKTYQAEQQTKRNLKAMGYTGATKAIGLSQDKLQEFSSSSVFEVTGKIITADSAADYDAIKSTIYGKIVNHALTNKDATQLLRNVRTAESQTAIDPNRKHLAQSAMQMFFKATGTTQMEDLMKLGSAAKKRMASGILERYHLALSKADNKLNEIEVMSAVLRESRLETGVFAPLSADGTARMKTREDATEAMSNLMGNQILMAPDVFTEKYRHIKAFTDKLDLEEDIEKRLQYIDSSTINSILAQPEQSQNQSMETSSGR